MLPNLDFIRTMLQGIRESVFARIKSVAAGLEYKISVVDAKIHDPDYAAGKGEPGYILNKPVLIGRPGEGKDAETFNNKGNVASGNYAHAEGTETEAKGYASHAEGGNTIASGLCSHAEGDGTTAEGVYAHAEGANSIASGLRAHTEGCATQASGADSHAEGYYTLAASQRQHVQGRYNAKDSAGKYAHIVGNGSAEDARSNAHTLDWNGNAWFAGNVRVGGSGQGDTEASLLLTSDEAAARYAPIDSPAFTGSVSMGRRYPVAVGEQSCAVGKDVAAKGAYAHAEGNMTTASGEASHAEGFGTTAEGVYAHAEGRDSVAGGAYAHAEGAETDASGAQAHAEGHATAASGSYTHAEGQGTSAAASCAHAEGFKTVASGVIAHAEGSETTAKGYAAHAEGQGTIAADYQHVQGRYNVEDTGYQYAHIVGNGTAATNEAGEKVITRANIHTLDWRGNAWFAGTVEGSALVLKTSGGKYFRLTVDDAGAIKITEILR